MTGTVRGRDFLSVVNSHPTSVAPPMAMATGSVRENPQVSPCGAMNAIQYQTRMPTQGRIRLTGMSPSHTARKTRSRRPLMELCLFHRDALREIARLVDVAPSAHGDMVGEQLER